MNIYNETEKKELNIKWYTIKSKEECETARIANLLSVYSETPFKIDGVRMESIAGFIAGVHFSEGDSSRKKAFGSWGYGARTAARKIIEKVESVTWAGKTIPCNSAEYYDLIEKAIKAKFEQNPDAMKALLSTKDLILANNDGPEKKYALLSSKKFCEIITKIRDEFVEKYKLFF